MGFMFVFVVSFVAILFERSHISEEALRAEQKKPLLGEYVKGESVAAGPGIHDYRDIVSTNLFQLNQLIDGLLAGTHASEYSTYSAEGIYRNLERAAVPEPYRSMHVALLGLAKEAAKKSGADKGVLGSGREKLYAAYPWLARITRKQ